MESDRSWPSLAVCFESGVIGAEGRLRWIKTDEQHPGQLVESRLGRAADFCVLLAFVAFIASWSGLVQDQSSPWWRLRILECPGFSCTGSAMTHLRETDLGDKLLRVCQNPAEAAARCAHQGGSLPQ